MLSTAHDEQQPITTDILVPVTIDGTPLKYDDNPAHAAGMAHAISEHWERVGLFEQLTKYGTVSMTNGRIACIDKDVIPFILGRYVEPVYTFASPCPPSAERISNLAAAHALDNSVLDWNPTANATITSAEQTNIVINHMVVRQEDQKMHRSLMYALSDVPDTAAALQASSGGSGQKLLASFIALKTEATQQDLTLVTNQLNQFIVNGFSGDLKLETFNAHYKAFGEVLRNVPPDKRSADVSYIVMMINSIMYKDPSIRDLWEIKSTVTANMDQLATVLKLARSILRSRKVAKEIDEISTPTSHPSLSADNRVVSATKAEKAALATLKSVKSLVSQGAENSKVAALLAKVDPEKDKKEKKKPRESKPLTANGALSLVTLRGVSPIGSRAWRPASAARTTSSATAPTIPATSPSPAIAAQLRVKLARPLSTLLATSVGASGSASRVAHLPSAPSTGPRPRLEPQCATSCSRCTAHSTLPRLSLQISGRSAR